MKRAAATIATFAVCAASLSAQTYIDAYNYSRQNYEGTARSIAMGNAFTALGGDMGGIGINPAGSGVYRYSEAAITFGGSFGSASSAGISGEGFGDLTKGSQSRFVVPNFGAVFHFDMHRSRGLKSMTFAVVYNRVQDYNSILSASGVNSSTSWAGALAANSSGIASNLIEKDPFYNGVPWGTTLGWYTGAISNVNGWGKDKYAGITDNIYGDKVSQGGALDQQAVRSTYGSKSDFLVNLGMNFGDIVYAGVNLGLVAGDYTSDTRFSEYAIDSKNFQTGFISLHDRYVLKGISRGIYGKFGVIVTPVGGLRIGAAVQTPTALTVTERWFEDLTVSSTQYGTAKEGSPEGSYTYRMTSPFRYNVGAAYTFGNIGLVSVDYEATDYSSISLRGSQAGEFDGTNSDIRAYLGTSHSVRAGVEINPVQWLAVRGGFNYISSPDKTVFNEDTFIYSAGIGYRSHGSFYADLAARYVTESERYMPYSYLDGSKNAPVIGSDRSLLSVIFTVGFRF